MLITLNKQTVRSDEAVHTRVCWNPLNVLGTDVFHVNPFLDSEI